MQLLVRVGAADLTIVDIQPCRCRNIGICITAGGRSVVLPIAETMTAMPTAIASIGEPTEVVFDIDGDGTTTANIYFDPGEVTWSA